MNEPNITKPPAELEAFFSLRGWETMAEEERKLVCEIAEISRAAGRREALGGTLKALEEEAIKNALRVTEGSVAKAAKLLGIGRATLYRRLGGEGLFEGARAHGEVTP